MKTTNTTEQKNANLVISNYGNGIAVGIQGSKEQIEIQFNRFFNLGGAANGCTSNYCSNDKNVGDDYLHEMSDSFAYFLSTEEAMLDALTNEKIVNLNSKPNPEFKGRKGGVLSEIKMQAKEEYDKIERENFMQYKTSDVIAMTKIENGKSDWDKSSMSYSDMAILAAYAR